MAGLVTVTSDDWATALLVMVFLGEYFFGVPIVDIRPREPDFLIFEAVREADCCLFVWVTRKFMCVAWLLYFFMKSLM